MSDVLPGNEEDLDDYDYDVFISYRHISTGSATKWVEKNFVPILIDCLAFELDHDPRVFFDKGLETATSWPLELGHKLARSRTLMALWSKNFLQSDWCTLELSLMRAREKALGFRTEQQPKGLISICVIHDGEKLPGDLGAILKFEVRDLYNTRMLPESQDAADLEDAVRAQAVALAEMIERAPPFHAAWPEQAAAKFYETYRERARPSQKKPPTFTGR